MSNTEPETSHSNYLFSIFGALGSMALFLVIILIAYVYMQRPAPVDQQTIQNRIAKVTDVNAKETALTTEYAWVNQKEGTVRVPVDLAMTLAVKEIAAQPDGIFPPAETTTAAAASSDKASSEDSSAEDSATEDSSSEEKSAEGDASAEDSSSDESKKPDDAQAESPDTDASTEEDKTADASSKDASAEDGQEAK